MATKHTNEEIYDFLLSLGTDEIAHTGHDFLTHLKSVQGVLEAAGAAPEIAQAGLLHSIYGTQGFQDFSLPLSERDRVRDLIGERAEFTAYCNCVMDRATFDTAVAQALEGDADNFEIRDREGSPPIALTRAQLTDLAEVHLFDWLEQVERSDRGWDYRRRAYRQMAELVGPRATAAYDAVFAREPAAT
jgi:hypothetical protein